MEIQIDVNLLIEEDISADDFTALYILYRNGHDLVEKMKLKPNWIDLQHKGFVKLGASYKTHVVRHEQGKHASEQSQAVPEHRQRVL